MTGTGLGGNAFETLFLGIISLGDGGVQFMAAAGVVALKLVVDLSGSSEHLFKIVGSDQGRGSVHLIEVIDFVRDSDEFGIVIKFLLGQFFAEYGAEFLKGHGLKSSGVEKGCRLVLHVGAEVVISLGKFVLREIDLIGNFVSHFYIHPFLLFFSFFDLSEINGSLVFKSILGA
jgi:hypothetical protein